MSTPTTMDPNAYPGVDPDHEPPTVWDDDRAGVNLGAAASCFCPEEVRDADDLCPACRAEHDRILEAEARARFGASPGHNCPVCGNPTIHAYCSPACRAAGLILDGALTLQPAPVATPW